MLNRLCAQTLYLACIGEVCHYPHRAMTTLSNLLDDLVQFLLIAGVEDHRTALGCECMSNCIANASTSSRHKNNLPF